MKFHTSELIPDTFIAGVSPLDETLHETFSVA